MSKRLRMVDSPLLTWNGSSLGPPVCLQDLPLEILSQILTYLTRRDWLHLRLVSKGIRDAVDHSGVWKKIRLKVKTIPKKGHRMWDLLQTWNITSVTIGAKNFSPKQLRHLVNYTQLEEIHLSFEQFLTLYRLKCKKMLKYDIPNVCLCGSFWDPFRWREFPLMRGNIKKLCIRNYYYSIDDLLLKLSRYNLTHLDIDLNKSATPDLGDEVHGVTESWALLTNMCTNLVYLRLHSIYLTGVEPLFGDTLPETGLDLETLDLGLIVQGLQGTRYDLFSGCNPRRLQKLKVLRLNFMSTTSDDTIRKVDMAHVQINSDLKLTELMITCDERIVCTTVDSQWLTRLPRTLRVLLLFRPGTDEKKFIGDLGDILGGQLTKLHIGQTNPITRSMLLTFITKFTAMETLICSFHDKVQPPDILQLGDMKSLRRLGMLGSRFHHLEDGFNQLIKEKERNTKEKPNIIVSNYNSFSDFHTCSFS